jgi:cell division protein FtsI (penicillin-binding protein 3)
VAAGKVRPYKRWRPIEQATMAYGYGLSTSLLQLAQVYTAYAGDGTLYPARLLAEHPAYGPRMDGLHGDSTSSVQQAAVEGESPGEDQPEDRVAAQAGRPVTTPATARAIRTMLEMAVGAGGTGQAAAVDGYRVGGKTGTARKQIGATYAKNRYRALFVGMAPMSDPRLIVAVMIDDPAGKVFYGGTVAGPVFGAVAGGALQLLGVPPDA